MAARQLTGYQREVAERNVEAILDAAEELLRSQGQASISAVAVAGREYPGSRSTRTSRPGQRSWRRPWNVPCAGRWPPCSPCAPRTARPSRRWTGCSPRPGSTWRRYRRWPRRWPSCSSPEAVTRTHQAAHHTIGALLERGQADGSFRTDLPAGWLVTASIALVHACSDQVRAGHIDEHDAVRILTTSVRDLFTGTQPRTESGHAQH